MRYMWAAANEGNIEVSAQSFPTIEDACRDAETTCYGYETGSFQWRKVNSSEARGGVRYFDADHECTLRVFEVVG
jgi:hypothetical protein